MYDPWRQGQASQEEYRAVVRICREKTRKAKAQLELKLAGVVSDNKGFLSMLIARRDLKKTLDRYLLKMVT